MKPMLSAIRKLEMTHRSICLPDLPAVSQIGRARRRPIEVKLDFVKSDRDFEAPVGGLKG